MTAVSDAPRVRMDAPSPAPDHGHLEVIVSRLATAFPDVAVDDVRSAVSEALGEMADARLPHYVPLLVERHARAACRALQRRGLYLQNAMV